MSLERYFNWLNEFQGTTDFEITFVEFLKEKINEADDIVQSTDYKSLSEEYDILATNSDNLSKESFDKWGEIERKLNRYTTAIKFRLECYLKSIALFYCHNEDISTLAQELPELSTHTENQIRIYHEWMLKDFEIIATGKIVQFPLFCEVGELKFRHTYEREFYTLLKFLKEFNEQKSKDITFKKKSETPDFITMNGSEDLGIEITEIAAQRTMYEEIESRSLIYEVLKQKYESANLFISFSGIDSWASLSPNKDAIVEYVDSIVQRTSDEMTEFSEEYQFQVTISKNSERFEIYEDIDFVSVRDVAEQIVLSIKKKVFFNNGSFRRKPSTDKTYLVGYLNQAWFFKDFETLQQLVRNDVVNEWSEYFTEVWVISGDKLEQIL